MISKFRCHARPIKVKVIFHRYTTDFGRQQGIRDTWGNSNFSYANDDWKIYFTMVRVKDDQVMSTLREILELYKFT